MEMAFIDASFSEVEKEKKFEITPDNRNLATYGDDVLKSVFCEVMFGDKK